MPFATPRDLPESLREHLLAHVRHIGKEAFNSAWDEYGYEEERVPRVAWSAVREQYHKDAIGKWVEGKSQDA